MALLMLGHQLAARRLPEHAQVAFCQCWLARVLPLAVDRACDEHLATLPTEGPVSAARAETAVTPFRLYAKKQIQGPCLRL